MLKNNTRHAAVTIYQTYRDNKIILPAEESMLCSRAIQFRLFSDTPDPDAQREHVWRQGHVFYPEESERLDFMDEYGLVLLPHFIHSLPHETNKGYEEYGFSEVMEWFFEDEIIFPTNSHCAYETIIYEIPDKYSETGCVPMDDEENGS